MNINLDLVLTVLALVFFALGTFNAVSRINATCAGLFCITLTLLV